MTRTIGGRMKSIDVASWFAVALTGVACGGAPPPPAAPPPAAQLASEAIDKSVAGALAFDAPIDAAVALDERGGDGFAPLTAFSVGVRSVDAARAAAKDLGAVTEIGPGEFKINLRGKRKKDK